MTNNEITARTDEIRQQHRVLYNMTSRGDHSSNAYRAALAALSQMLAYASQLISAAPEAAGRSRGRISERPPFGVDVAPWREFIAQFNAARTTWFNETGAGTAVTSAGALMQPPAAGGSSMAIDYGYVSRVTPLLSRLHAPVYRAVSANTAPVQADVTALTLERNRARYQVNSYAESLGVSANQIATRPPRGVETAAWRDLLAMINAVNHTLESAARLGAAPAGAASTGARETPSVSALRQPATTPAAPATTPAAPERRTQSRRVSSGGSGRRAAVDEPPSGGDGGGAPDGGPLNLGFIASWQRAFRTLAAMPTDAMQQPDLRSLPFIDRLQRTLNILNPIGRPLYSRPWFPVVVIGGGSYIAYNMYKQQEAAKKRLAGTKKAERPAGLPAPAGGGPK